MLHIGDVDLVDWLCGQVDPGDLCGREPVPLSQGVLLSLISQLGTNLTKVRANATAPVCCKPSTLLRAHLNKCACQQHAGSVEDKRGIRPADMCCAASSEGGPGCMPWAAGSCGLACIPACCIADSCISPTALELTQWVFGRT